MNRIFGGLWLAGVGCAVLVGACAGKSSEVGRMDDPGAGTKPDGGTKPDAGTKPDGGTKPDAGTKPDGGPVPDGNAGAGTGTNCEPGATRAAPDGCNTCSCVDDGSGWACTEIGCECKDGDLQASADGCNTCVCSGGRWQCDTQDCGSTKCKPSTTRISDDQCSTCTCGTDGQWDCPPTGTGCSDKCEEGALLPAGDGCNTCSCFHGSWSCTTMLCGKPSVCEAGLADCDGDSLNGCETKTLNDAMNCGACGNYCALPGAQADCSNGECVIARCEAPNADCNGDPKDGCEVTTGAAGCNSRCDYPVDGPSVVPATGNCECPSGMTCVRHTAADKGDYCYAPPEGCADGVANCSCLGGCVCPNAGKACSEVMAVGGFRLDCAGLFD